MTELDPRFNPDLAAEASTAEASVDVLDAIDQHIARLSSADLSFEGVRDVAAEALRRGRGVEAAEALRRGRGVEAAEAVAAAAEATEVAYIL